MGVASENVTGAELEWQWIVDPIPTSGLGVSFHAAEAKEINRKEEAASLSGGDNEQGFGENTGKDTTSKSDSLLERSLKESLVLLLNCGAEATELPAVQVGIQQRENTDTVMQLSGTCLSDEQTVEMQGIQHHGTMDTSIQLRAKSFIDGQCAEIFVSDFRKVVETPATLASSVSWRTANKEALAALVAQKSAARLENCDLPTPLSKSLLTAAPQMVEPEVSQIMEQNLIASIFQAGGDLMHSESLELPASPLTLGRSETNSGDYQVRRMISQPLTVPTIHRVSSNLFHGSHSLRYVLISFSLTFLLQENCLRRHSRLHAYYPASLPHIINRVVSMKMSPMMMKAASLILLCCLPNLGKQLSSMLLYVPFISIFVSIRCCLMLIVLTFVLQ
jgi:hypothetical protein